MQLKNNNINITKQSYTHYKYLCLPYCIAKEI